MRAAGISLSPLKYTSLRFPKSLKESIQLFKMRQGNVRPKQTIDGLIQAQAEEQDRDRKERFRASRQKYLKFKMHKWDESGPKETLWQLAHTWGGIESPSSSTFTRIKELYLSNNISGREAVERALSEEAKLLEQA
jgi:hypothetical protein